jgi:hypothetical protein
MWSFKETKWLELVRNSEDEMMARQRWSKVMCKMISYAENARGGLVVVEFEAAF